MTPFPAESPTPTHPQASRRADVEPLDPWLSSIQTGGGVCMRLELAWGAVRRAILKTFWPGYVRRMAELRRGTPQGCPHEILDPRDVKFFRQRCGCWWDPADDPFAWRDRLPFARVGLAELLIFASLSLALAALAFLWMPWLAIVPIAFGLFFAWFFRNPRRRIPTEPGVVVSPADGVVVTIEELEHEPYLGGPAVVIGIFLSVFNVHINRVPVAAKVIGMTYRRGKFLNALRAASARENEQLSVRLEELEAPYRRMIVTQIAGAIARRIVCWVVPGEELTRGECFGMIKLGSRTELILPKSADLTLHVRLGEKVSAGSSMVARYQAQAAERQVK